MTKKRPHVDDSNNNEAMSQDEAAFSSEGRDGVETSSTHGPVKDLVPDPFADLGKLRLSQDFASVVGVRPVITTVAVRKPNRHEWVRVRAGEEWRLETGIFTDKTDRECYMVAPDLWPALPGEIQPTVLFLAMTRNSPLPLIWPVSLPGPDGRTNRWHESALAAATRAQSTWIRLAADMATGCYQVFEATSELAPPEWPDMTFSELLRIAFGERFVSGLDHPVLRRLRGEA